MPWCLIKSEADKFKRALVDGEIDPVALSRMTSDERMAKFRQFTNADNALQINSLFESKMLLKNQQRGYISWAKRVTGLSSLAKRDMISRIERLDKVLSPQEEEQFLRSLASTRLGLGVTRSEAKTLHELTKEITTLKEKANEDGVFPTEQDRLNFGWSVVALENYVNDLKLDARKMSFKDQPVEKSKRIIGEIPGALKSMVASLDNSFWGRQGIKTLLDLRTAPLWTRNFLKSWVDIARELRGKVDTMDVIRADIYSRPNAINGKYDVGKYGLGVLAEEAFPSSIPEKIPLLGRLFRASEKAYNGGALRVRADLADRYIEMAEKQGVNTLNRLEAEGIGHLVSSMTGRGSIGKLESVAKEINVLLFSIKFLKSNLDTLTAHRGIFGLFSDKKVLANRFARKESAKSTMSIILTIASILALAKWLDDDSVELDPRSTNFGKVKVFGHWTDISGGMASLVVLASRLVPTRRNGEWGFWYKSSAGNYTKLGEKYGGMTALDVMESFIEGKLSPVAGIFRDVWKGKDFSGAPVTAKGELQNVVTPISVQSYMELTKDPETTPIDLVGAMILDILGLSVSTYIPSQFDWNASTGKTLTQFKEKVGQEEFDKANDQFNQEYTQWLETVIATDEYKQLSDDGKTDVRSQGKEEIQDKIFKEYGFKYKTERKTPEEKQEDKDIKNLLEETLPG